MSAKVAAAAALDRAETAARRALAGVGTGGWDSRRGGASRWRTTNNRQDRARSLPAEAQPRAASTLAAGWTPGGGFSSCGSGLPWDSSGLDERLAWRLRSSSELRHVSSRLEELHGRDEHVESLGRQIAEVQRTRAMIAAAMDGCTAAGDAAAAVSASPAASSPLSLRHRRPKAPNADGTVLSSASPSGAPRLDLRSPTAAAAEGGRAALAPPAMPSSSSPQRSSSQATGASGPADEAPQQEGGATRRRERRAARIIEMCPVPLPQSAADSGDCVFCLSPLVVGESAVCFPCPAGHWFHSACLLPWLRVAGNRFTCPVCRACPGAPEHAGGAGGGSGSRDRRRPRTSAAVPGGAAAGLARLPPSPVPLPLRRAPARWQPDVRKRRTA